jgi:hypothetical protein
MSDEHWVPGKGFVRAFSGEDPVTDDSEELDVLLGEPEKLRYRGETHDFYKIGSLARALNRAVGTIRKWEKSGYIPKPDFGLPTRALGGKVRLYSLPQIRGLREISEEEGLLFDLSKAVTKTEFADKARALFDRIKNEA